VRSHVSTQRAPKQCPQRNETNPCAASRSHAVRSKQIAHGGEKNTDGCVSGGVIAPRAAQCGGDARVIEPKKRLSTRRFEFV